MKKKTLLLSIVAVVLIVSVAIAGTLAYFTDTKEVTNTFAIGNIKIDLDEPEWTEDSKLIPNTTIAKDPTVTVLKDSEEAYVRLFVTVNKLVALKTLGVIDTQDDILSKLFEGYDGDIWKFAGYKPTVTNNTAIIEFRYYMPVAASATDTVLEPLFTGIKIPYYLNGDDVATLAGISIDIIAQAIQTAGFNGDVDAAWAAWA